MNERLITAIKKVEASGEGFLGGKVKVRFEPHVFNKRSAHKMPFTNNGRGFSSKAAETNRAAFEKALELDPKAALESTSFGKYQIMGFNWKRCATSLDEFYEKMQTEEGQDECFIKFVNSNKYLREILNKETITKEDCYRFAKIYNGPSNVLNYGNKIWKAYG